MSDVPNGNGKAARWGVILSALGLAFVVGAALYGLLHRIDDQGGTIGAQASMITELQAKINDMGARTDRLADAYNKLLADTTGIKRDLVEVDSQLCAEDAVRNLVHANDLRDMAFLWKRVLGDPLATDNAYYPRIGRCGGPPETR